MKFCDSIYVRQFAEIAANVYRLGWGERNGGNISYLVPDDDLANYEDVIGCSSPAESEEAAFCETSACSCKNPRTIDLKLDIKSEAPSLIGKCFLVTATGSYFRNVPNNLERDLGLIRIREDSKGEILWGYSEGGRPTSEFAGHLLSHGLCIERNPNHCVLMHCHPTNLVAMTLTVEEDERVLTNLLWRMHTESMMVFPEGVGLVPCMVPGSMDLARATAEKLRNFNAVAWSHHGLFTAGSSLDEAFGLQETVEKAATIYNLSMAASGIRNSISNDILLKIAESMGSTPNKDMLV